MTLNLAPVTTEASDWGELRAALVGATITDVQRGGGIVRRADGSTHAKECVVVVLDTGDRIMVPAQSVLKGTNEPA